MRMPRSSRIGITHETFCPLPFFSGRFGPFFGPRSGRRVWIVEDGQPRAEIVVAQEPAPAAEFGACELQNYIEKITGCQLKIVAVPSDSVPVHIYVGESVAARRVGVNAEGLARDSFRMVSGSDWLALLGSDVEFEPKEPWPASGAPHGRDPGR